MKEVASASLLLYGVFIEEVDVAEKGAGGPQLFRPYRKHPL